MIDNETKVLHLKHHYEEGNEIGRSIFEGVVVPTKDVLTILKSNEVSLIHNYIQNVLDQRKFFCKIIGVKGYGFSRPQRFYNFPTKDIFIVSDGAGRFDFSPDNKFYYEYSKEDLNFLYSGDDSLVYPSEYKEGDKFYTLRWFRNQRYTRKELKALCI